MPTDPDRLTKQDAAARLHVSERTVDQYVKAGKLDPRKWRPQGRGQWRTGFLVEDVEKLVAEARGGPATPFLVPATAGPATGTNNHHHPTRTALARTADAVPSGEDILRLVFAMAQRALTREGPQEDPKGPQAPQGPQLSDQERAAQYVDVDQASVIKGWTARDLRRAIRTGELPAKFKERRDWRTWRVKRKDLEAL